MRRKVLCEPQDKLTAPLAEPISKSVRLEAAIKKNLMGLGYEC